MERKQRGAVALGLLAAAAVFGAAGWLAASATAPQQVQGYIRNGRLIQTSAPALPDPAVQRNEMIASLHAIEKKLADLETGLGGMQRALEAIERHGRATYVLLGNQKDASPKE